MKNRKTVYKAAAETFGVTLQTTVAIEELSELQKELCKYLRGKAREEAIIEEMADVRIVMEQIQYLLNIPEGAILEVMDAKIDRLADRVWRKQREMAMCGEDFPW